MVTRMLVLAHRGANRLAPENTVAAMTAAVELGADGVELDVHRSADGTLVVRHDAQTPDGPVGALTVERLHELSPEVPRLVEVLDACRGTCVDVEVKDPDPRAAEALVALLRDRGEAGVEDDVIVSSFDLATVDRVHAAAPHLPVGLLSFGLEPEAMLASAVAHGFAAVHPDIGTLLAHGADAFVARAHDHGVRVNVWTVNDADQMVALRDAGVDAAITDDVELYRFGVRGR
jgi:glycerophosphoryl diester phosphodiesterase